jgi:hypothetical protein
MNAGPATVRVCNRTTEKNVPEVGCDISRVRVVQLPTGDVEIQVHAQSSFGRPAPIKGGFRNTAFIRHAFHRQSGITISPQNLAGH